MKTLNFEALKVSLRQNKDGYILTLNIHPDDIPEDLLRDFVGAHYQVVMVRLNGDNQPLDRQQEYSGDRAIRIAGLLCRDPQFWSYLVEHTEILNNDEDEATEWLRNELGIKSRSELKTNPDARAKLETIHTGFTQWKKG